MSFSKRNKFRGRYFGSYISTHNGLSIQKNRYNFSKCILWGFFYCEKVLLYKSYYLMIGLNFIDWNTLVRMAQIKVQKESLHLKYRNFFGIWSRERKKLYYLERGLEQARPRHYFCLKTFVKTNSLAMDSIWGYNIGTWSLYYLTKTWNQW